MNKPKIIAFYLPQYHPTPDNDKWWGKGFTEWTNVGKAKPLFRGHYQPKVPADLGYYDLRLPEVREAQAELAREAGIYGFCYYHYWFGNGKEELELPFNEVLRLGKPDFPFMLCWANESWHKKFWDKDGNGSSKELLIEQTYPGEQDIIDHFYRLLPAFKDLRYIRINGKPAFMIYKPELLPDNQNIIQIWTSLAKKHGLGGINFIAYSMEHNNYQTLAQFEKKGYSSVCTFDFPKAVKNHRKGISRILYKIRRLITRQVRVDSYPTFVKNLATLIDTEENVYPTILPNWDHTPRSGRNGFVLDGSSPKNFRTHLKNTISLVSNKQSPIIFLKSWNEWGEGNYVEPDLKYGKQYLDVLKEVLLNLYKTK